MTNVAHQLTEQNAALSIAALAIAVVVLLFVIAVDGGHIL